MKFEINIAKKHLYYLAGLLVFVFIVGIAIAQTANNPGHPAEQIDEGTIAGTLTISGGNVGIGTTSPAEKVHVTGGNLAIGETSGGTTRALKFFDGTASTFSSIINPSSAGLRFLTNNGNTDAMSILSNGNVGIGTANPTALLDVNGGVYIGELGRKIGTDALSISGDTVTNLGGNIQLYGSSHSTKSDYIELRRDGTISMIVDGNGNVGIGTTSPSAKLEVVGANSKFQLTDTGFLYGGYNGAGSFSITPGSWSNGNLILNAAGSGNIILGNSVGKVGIGTASPSSVLTVSGSAPSGQPLVNINNPSSTTDTSYGLSVQGGGNSAGSGYELRTLDQSGNVDFFIRGDGAVGIGTASPTATLHVAGSIRAESIIQMQAAGGNQFEWYPRTDGLGLYDRTVGAYDLMILNNGNVGIGTTGPTAKLHVAGVVKATAFNTGDIVFNKDDKPVWRMFEDEEGLYLESLKTGETYRFLLQKIE